MTDNRTIRLSDAIKVVQDNLAFSVKADIIKALSALPAVGELRYERVNGRTIMEMRESLSPAMYNAGDCVLIWVNEGDLCLLPTPPEIE